MGVPTIRAYNIDRLHMAPPLRARSVENHLPDGRSMGCFDLFDLGSSEAPRAIMDSRVTSCDNAVMTLFDDLI